jgi:acyl CoA:acetate/3-ketoacid CoA transferase
LSRDILAMMEFQPQVSPNLKTMDPSLFQPYWGKLGDFIKRNPARDLDRFPVEPVSAV